MGLVARGRARVGQTCTFPFPEASVSVQSYSPVFTPKRPACVISGLSAVCRWSARAAHCGRSPPATRYVLRGGSEVRAAAQSALGFGVPATACRATVEVIGGAVAGA